MEENMTRGFNRFVLLLCIIATMPLSNGCFSQSKTSMPSEFVPLSSSVGSFDDIELPSEMELDSDKSMAIKTDSFRGGIFVYSGKVEIHSLKDYIASSMNNHKWKHVGEASSRETMMAFIKPNKTCMITLTEGFGGSLGSTYLTMYITVDVAASKRLNPFGEPISQ